MKKENFFKRLVKKSDGTAAIEFAIVVPLLFFLLFATMEVAMIMFIRTGIESATSQAGRIGKTGYLDTKYKSREEYIKAAVEKKLGRLVDTSELVVELRSYDDFSKIDQPEPDCTLGDPGCVGGGPKGGFIDVNGNGVYDDDLAVAGAGGPGAVVVYTVEYDYPLQTPMVGLLTYIANNYGGSVGTLPFNDRDSDGDSVVDETVFHISSRVVVQNEVFP